MTDFGLTSAGFNRKQLQDILKSIQDRHRATFGEGIDVAIATELGQLDGNFASELAECWEVLEVGVNGFDPEKAADYLLTVLASLTGTIRRAAKASKFTALHPLTVNLNAGSTFPADSLIYPAGRPDITFSIDADVHNAGGSPADFPALATCTQTGPILIVASTTWVIQTPASGVNSVTNADDCVVGRDVDTDTQLRQRRQDELALRGGSTIRAIRADLLDIENHPELTGINSVFVLENTSSVPDANALPPKSFEVLIDDGDTPTVANNDVAQAIFDSKPAGIDSVGGTSGTAIDENLDNQTEFFTRVTPKPVYIDLTLTTGEGFPGDGAAQVKAAIVALGIKYKIHQDVVALALRAAALTVSGVIDVPAFTLGFSPSPGGTANLSIGVRERAKFDSTLITVS